MTIRQRNALLAIALVAVVALDLWVQHPSTTGEWVKAILFLALVVVWTDYRARQRSKDKRSEAGQ
jgi:hypothetical protein